ncbi:MAG: LysM peptidoglycan-binding domain-containing protein [Anaerolineales bacterium]|nr:LysM peptidoglycan-binding domain-containing protein [Anaerolineales bacterium]
MANSPCPYLGRRDDPSTMFNYPSVGNFCQHVRPLAPPSEEHQLQYCLSGHFQQCSVYQAPEGKRIPPSLQMVEWTDAPTLQNNLSPWLTIRQLGVILLFGVVMLIGVVFFVLMNSARVPSTAGNPTLTSTLIPTRPIATATLFPMGGTEKPSVFAPLPTDTPAPSLPTETLVASPLPTLEEPATPTASPTICTPPAGWTIYSVQAGQTLTLLSTATGITVAQLQQGNCMGTSTQIFTGQKLYVPKLPELPTPSPTSALVTEPIPTSNVSTPVPPTASPTPSATPETQPTEAPPTLSPPTATPNPGI